jgi:hypothetical protein
VDAAVAKWVGRLVFVSEPFFLGFTLQAGAAHYFNLQLLVWNVENDCVEKTTDPCSDDDEEEQRVILPPGDYDVRYELTVDNDYYTPNFNFRRWDLRRLARERGAEVWEGSSASNVVRVTHRA